MDGNLGNEREVKPKLFSSALRESGSCPSPASALHSLAVLACFLPLQHTQPFPAPGPLHRLFPRLECPPTMTRTCLDRSHFLSLWENVTSSEGAPLFTLSALNFYLITLFLPFFHSTHLEMFAFLPFSPRLECNLHEGRDLIYLIPTPELPVFSNYQYLAVPSME